MSAVKIAALVSTLLAVAVTIFMNFFLNNPSLSPFNTTVAEVSQKYITGITPSNPTFAIWGLIYSWLLVGAIYCQLLICRKTDGQPLYIRPGFISSLYCVSLALTLIGNIVWLLVFLSVELTLAAAVLVLGLGAAVVSLWSSVQRLDECGPEMTRLGLKTDIWLTRMLVQNSVALYTGWSTCATIIGLIMAAAYSFSVPMASACYVGLAVLAAIVLVWFICETFVFDRQLRYVFGQYIAFLAALGGCYQRNYDPAVLYTQFALGVLVVAAACAAVKILVMIVKTITNPIRYEKTEKPDVI